MVTLYLMFGNIPLSRGACSLVCRSYASYPFFPANWPASQLAQQAGLLRDRQGSELLDLCLARNTILGGAIEPAQLPPAGQTNTTRTINQLLTFLSALMRRPLLSITNARLLSTHTCRSHTFFCLEVKVYTYLFSACCC